MFYKLYIQVEFIELESYDEQTSHLMLINILNIESK